MYVHVGGLAPQATDLYVRGLFEPFGEVTAVRFTTEPAGSGPRLAFVEMPEPGKALAAIRALGSRVVSDRPLVVCEAMRSRSPLESATFRSFLRFLGDVQFVGSRELYDILDDLEGAGVEWVTSLADGAHDPLASDPLLRKSIEGRRLLTLGPLEGVAEWHLAHLSVDRITGVEGYRPNYLKCLALEAAFPSLPIDFVERDVRDLALEPEFDVVACFGVLYHLHRPQRLLAELMRLRPAWAFLATQAAVDPPHPAFDARQIGDSGSIEFDGESYGGRWYAETRDHRHDYRSALDEEPSFWFYPAELRRLLERMGFGIAEWRLRDMGAEGLLVGAVLSTPGR